MRNFFGSWVLIGLLTTICAFAQTPTRKRPPLRTTSTSNTLPVVAVVPPLKPDKFVGQILDSMLVRPNLRAVTIPLADLSVNPATAMLTAGSQAYLDSVVLALNRLPTLRFDVVGYATAPGDSVKSRLDAEKRSRIVWSYLASNGKVAPNRTQYQGYSSLRPVVSKNTRLSSVRNPRVRLALTGLDTSRVMMLYLTNTTTVEAAFSYKDEAAGTFFYKTATDAPLLSLPISQVSKITDKPREIPLATAASTTQADNQPTDSKSAETANGAARSAYRYTTLTIGAEGLYVLPGPSTQWADGAVGPGVRQGFGGSLRLTRRFGRWVGISVGAGYGQWEVQRTYRQDGTSRYDESIKLQRIPVSIGTKIYPLKRLYLMPYGALYGLRLTTVFSEQHPVSSASDQQQGLCAGYGGEIGFEFGRRRVFCGELGLQYGNVRPIGQPIIWYAAMNEPMHTVGVRLALGLRTLKPNP